MVREDIVEFLGTHPRPAEGLCAAGEGPVGKKFEDDRCEDEAGDVFRVGVVP